MARNSRTDRGQSAGAAVQRPPRGGTELGVNRRWKTEWSLLLERLAECNPKHQAAQQYKTEMEAQLSTSALRAHAA